jgi:hypothetical protein
MKLFIDTAFSDEVNKDLVSITLVAEDGRYWCAGRSGFNRVRRSDFVRKVLLPPLGKRPDQFIPMKAMKVDLRSSLEQFADPCVGQLKR